MLTMLKGLNDFDDA